MFTGFVGSMTASAQTPTVEYYHTDAVGSVRAVTDSSRAVLSRHDYAPFGEEIPPTPLDAEHLRFTGKERDSETGLDYVGARYYASQTGRFTTVDPVQPIDAAVRDPQLWNRYAYARNNPLRYTDPDGRCVEDACAVEIAAVIVGYTATVNAITYLQSPAGQQAVRDAAQSAGAIITTAVESVRSWFHAENTSEPPQLKAGKEAHKNEEIRPGEKAEVRTPSGTGRMDRYDADKAHIREIKPDNARGKQTGERQLDQYRKEMEDVTKRPHTVELTKYPKPKEKVIE